MKLTLFLASLIATTAFVPHKLTTPSSAVLPRYATLTPSDFTSTAPDMTVAAVPRIAQRWRKSTKQVVTVGPAVSDKDSLEKLFLAGADVFRLNFSHGDPAEKKERLEYLREIELKYNHPIAVLGDLQGPKLRLGQFVDEQKFIIKKGDMFRLDSDPTLGDATRVHLPHPEIIAASQVGHTLLINDGKVSLTVVEKGDGFLNCRVEATGMVSDRKGVNTPDCILEISPLTPKDRADLEYMLDIGVDWVALSFVQTPDDIREIKEIIENYLPEDAPRPNVMAKIEKPSCFYGTNLEEIVSLCDGIMVARGDLGVEMPPEDVPLLQKTIIDECRKQGRPVVVATQMLESMIEAPTPTRAEASDVATAIFDGADAIMLSAETAAGDYPEESVLMQQRIINRVEADRHYQSYMTQNEPIPENTPTDAIIVAARQIATTIDAKAMVVFSLRGTSVQRASKKRPKVPILALCPFKETARKLSLSWGVYPDLPKAGLYDAEVGETTDDFELVLRNACRAALTKGLVSDPEDLMVVTAGLPFGTPGASNIIRVLPAAGPACWEGECKVI